MTQLEPKNKHWGLDKGEVTEMWGRKLYRVVAIAPITLMNVQEGQRGGWCSEEAIVGERVQWVPPMVTFWGGTFRGGTFRRGTLATRSPISLSGLRWEITITDQHMTIGCQHHELKRWWQFEDRVIARMDADALEFWQAHKAALQTLCKGTDRVSEADGEAEA